MRRHQLCLYCGGEGHIITACLLQPPCSAVSSVQCTIQLPPQIATYLNSTNLCFSTSPHRLWFHGELNLNPASLETQCLEETLLPWIENTCTPRISSWDAHGCHNTNLVLTGTPVQSCGGVSLVFIPVYHLSTNLPFLVLKPSLTRNHHLSFSIQTLLRVLRLKARWRFLQSTERFRMYSASGWQPNFLQIGLWAQRQSLPTVHPEAEVYRM